MNAFKINDRTKRLETAAYIGINIERKPQIRRNNNIQD